ncbi:hypothetical protein [Paractinoplanes atraurantiacus]|uniref:DUF306 domain-containing protein n=1 Tax=Paractinoplanes atraurantiacus TaxID=1036182 RepID=A0A285JXG1_9ACTN|nr:hypothetical protein [Actinoplanes atraurantiacus]SNY65000.1 hypothetical protein SAMN05421748_127108 [Actinoplanes atraurantiacus]
MRHTYRALAVTSSALALATSLNACSNDSSDESAAPAVAQVHGQYPALDPFVGEWAGNCPNGQPTLSIDQKQYAGQISDGTTTTVVYLQTRTADDQPQLAFTREFNQYREGEDMDLAVKSLADGGQQLIIGDNEIVLALCSR